MQDSVLVAYQPPSSWLLATCEQCRPSPGHPADPLKRVLDDRVLSELGVSMSEKWRLFIDTCPCMFLQDRATGVFHASLPDKAPEGYLDHLLMIPEYQLLQGNYGSRTLLERV